MGLAALFWGLFSVTSGIYRYGMKRGGDKQL